MRSNYQLVREKQNASPQWPKMSISDLAEIIGGGTPKTSNPDYWNGDIPWLSVVDFNNDSRWVYKTEKSITQKGLKESSTKILKQGQLILSARGTVGMLAQLGTDMAFNQSCYGLNAKPDLATNDYLYYAIKNAVEDIKRNTHGAVFDTITKETLQHIKLPQPSVSEQKKITEVLDVLDRKIELNCQMNETLEATARALFKSWFIDFDPVRAKMEGRKPEGLSDELAALFPDRLVDSPLGLIPSGWEVKQLDQTIKLIGGGTPKTTIPEYWDGDIPWFSVTDTPSESNVFVIDTEKHISRRGLDNSSANLLCVGTTIVTARGTVGKLALVGVPMAMNQSCYGIRSINEDVYWTHFQVRKVVNELQQRTHGSVFDTITRATFSSILVIYPSSVLVSAFDRLVTPILERVKENIFSTLTLKKNREILLPKLISGQLHIAAAEKSR